MPVFNIRTNASLDNVDVNAFMKKASADAANWLGKPEGYLQVCVQPAQMTFAGTDEPTANVELHSIGLPDLAPKELTTRIIALIESTFGVAPDRIYVNFYDIKATHCGWNNRTFG